MASISEINAKAANKSERNEGEPVNITVRIGVFFDGTNNNRAQVTLGRLAREKKNEATEQEIKENNEILSNMKLDKLTKKERMAIEFSSDKAQTKREILNKRNKWRLGMPRSFMQGVGYTNIAILERFYQPKEQYDYSYKIYVTGSGTFADVSKGISVAGLAAGQGTSGVVQKNWDALDALATRISFFNFDSSISGVNYIFDVFGFSRGATEARLFVDLCCNRGNRPSVLRKGIKKYNKKFSNNICSSEDKIAFPKQKEIVFNVGVYDTVASVGVIRNSQWAPSALSVPVTGLERVSVTASTFHDENVRDLGLNTVAHDASVKKVIHICALDEYRENFALCALPDGGQVTQFLIPGIHTDIGGSELPGYRGEISLPIRQEKRRLKLSKVSLKQDGIEMTMENLKRLGWLKDETNTPNDMERDIFDDDDNVDNIDVKRFSIGIYSNLPLVIMAEKHGDVFENKNIKGKHAIPDKLPNSFEDMKAIWKGCSSNYGQCYFPKSEEDYKNLRLRYLHFSSSAGSVNGPHYNDNYCYERILYTENGTDTLKGS